MALAHLLVACAEVVSPPVSLWSAW